MEPIGVMLQLLGERLRGFTVTSPSSWSDDWCPRVLERCPCIEALALVGDDGDVTREAVVAWYTSDVCTATSLSVDMTKDVPAFLTALSDENLPLAAHVRVFHITALTVVRPWQWWTPDYAR
jgi:hypothetical protein